MYFQTTILNHDKTLPEGIHLLGISGSLRTKSNNTGLLRTAEDLLPKGMTLEIYDISNIPLYNHDLEADGEPAAVKDFKARITHADALLIATPEYNHSIPGVLKNALDWASRPYRRSPLNQKTLGIMGAAGRSGSINAQDHLRQIAAGMDMLVLEEPEVVVHRAWEKFDADGNLIDENTRKQVKDFLEALAVRVRSERQLLQII